MSHFTVLVPAKDEEELEAKLLPYHEYECTGIQAYLQFVPGNVEEMQAEFKEHGEEGQTFDEFVKDWYGYDKNEAGIWGRTTNPNKQWDWWVIGGRWSNLLKKVNGKKADYAQAGNVDWEGIRQDQFNQELRKYDAYQAIKTETANLPIPADLLEKCQTEYTPDNSHYEAMIKHFPTIEDYAHDRMMSRALWDANILIQTWDKHETMNLPKEEYIKKFSYSALTWAFIDLEGKWNQRGEMGWFGLHSNEEPDYDKVFWQFVQSLPANQMVYVVDCHI